MGQDFGKLGQVVENIPGKITDVTKHGELRLKERGLTMEILNRTVANPLVTLKQSGGTTYYLTKEAAVVLNEAGAVVTTYSAKEFMPHVLDLLNKLK